jgi:hypothetical protein
MQTQPDFFLPDIQTVLEVKGKCQNSMEFRKLVSTATQVKQGVLLGDVTYKSYVVAVQVTPSEMAHYLSVLADINRLVKTTQRGTFPLTGLKLLAALQRANVEAVPITYDKLSALVTKLKSKRATSQ